MRAVVAALGGWFAVRVSGRIEFLFIAIGLALAIFGMLNTIAVATGAWLPKRKEMMDLPTGRPKTA